MRTKIKAVFLSLMVLSLINLPVLAWAQKPQLRVWLLRTYVPDANQTLEETIKAWGQKKNVDVVIEYMTFDDIETKYVAAIETNTLPDVGQLQTLAPARYRGMGRLLELSDVVEEVVKANGPMLETAIPAVRFDGKFYAIPVNYITDMLFIRTDIFKKAGLKYPTTWEEVRQAAITIKKMGLMDYPLGQSWNRSADGYGVYQALLYSFGGGWTDPKGNYKPLASPAGLAALQWATEIYTKEKIAPPDAMAWTGFGNNEAFLSGKIAMTFNGPSIYYVLEKEKRPLFKDTVMVVKPAGPAGRNHDVFLLSFGVFTSTKHPDLAKDLIKGILAPAELKKYMYHSWGQMVPAYENLHKDPYWQKNESYRNVLKAPRYARVPGYPGPVTPAAAEVIASNVLTDMCARVIVDGWSIERAIKEADRRIKEIYDTVPH